MLLTHVEIKGQKKDTEKILFYVRNNGLEVLTQEIYAFNKLFNNLRPVRVFALSIPLSESKLKEKLVDIKSKDAFKELNIETIKIDNNYRIYAEGNTKILKTLPAYFTIKPGSGNFSNIELLRKQLGFPYSIIKKNGNINIVERQLSLDEFLSLNTASLDSEFIHWEKEKKNTYLDNTREQKINFLTNTYNQINGKETDKELDEKIVQFFNKNKGKQGIVDKPMSISSALSIKNIEKNSDGSLKYDVSIKKVIHMHHLSGKTEHIEMDLATGKTIVDSIKTVDENDMITQYNKKIENEDIIIFLTQNGSKYDLPKLKKFGLKFFGEKPTIKSVSGFFYQTIIKGNIMLDLAAYSQNYFPWTIDNKYETIVKQITGLDFEKSITYDDQTRLTLETILGNKESAKIMRKYDVEDATGILLTEKHILPMIYFKSKIAKTSPEVVNVTSKAKWALDLYRFENILEGKGFWKGSKMNEYNKFSTFKKFKELIDTHKKDFKEENVKKNNIEKNFIDGTIFYIAPFTSIYRSELLKNPSIKEAFEYLKRPQATNLEKIDMILTIEEGYLMPYIFDSAFPKSPLEDTIVKQFIELVNKFPPLNYNENFYCFDKYALNKKEFKNLIKGLGIELARGKLYNIKKGSFILYDGMNFYKKNIDVKGKAGFKTIYQSELIHDFIETLFKKGPDEAVEIATHFFKKLNEGTLDKNKLIYFKENIIKDYWDYSSLAQQQERVNAYIQLGLLQGDKAAFFKMKDDTYIDLKTLNTIPNEELFGEDMKQFIISEYLGKIKKNKVQMGESKIGKYLLPLAKYYGIKKEEFYKEIISGNHKNIIKNKQYELFDNQ